MNYELISKLTMEENEKLKIELSLLRNEILHAEVDRLQALVKKSEEEKSELKENVSSLKSALTFKKDQDTYDIPQYS